MKRLLFAGLALCLLAAPTALAQASVAPATDSSRPSPAGSEWFPPKPADAMKVIWPYLIVVLAVAALPLIIDLLAAYISRGFALRKLASLAENNKLDKPELQRLLEAMVKPPGGVSGLARTTMALAVIGVIGVAVFHVLVFYQPKPGGESPQVLTNVLSILGGLVAAVTGFYFGGRASAEGAAKKEEEKPEGEAKPPKQ